MRIVITEYPKSGGTWVVGMVGDALDLPKRDIYVTDSYTAFDVRKHPWYAGAPNLNLSESCVIKSHELPGSPLIGPDMKIVHLVRDGRDVVVSRYFYERDFCVANGIYREFNETLDDYVPRVAREWNDYVIAWLDAGVPYFRYEDFLCEPATALRSLLRCLNSEPPEPAVRGAIESNTKEKLRASLARAFTHNTFVRKAAAGDWRNHFGGGHISDFRSAAAEAMGRLGYAW